MKIFVILCVLLPLGQQAVSLAPEDQVRHYVMKSHIISQVIHKISAFMMGVDTQVQQLAEDIQGNITNIQSMYGAQVSADYHREFGGRRAKFAAERIVRRDCIQYIDEHLEEDTQHQKELSQYISKAANSWRNGFDSYAEAFDRTTKKLSDLEKESLDCGLLLLGNDNEAPYICINKAEERVWEVEKQAIAEIYNESARLIQTRNSCLTSLNQSIKDRFIPEYYYKDGMIRWLSIYCPDKQ